MLAEAADLRILATQPAFTVPPLSNGHKQVRSRQRVTAHGEVFTSPREVNAMLDLVQQETERIESRFLEPACGNGNFLVPVLLRKLTVATARFKKEQLEWERNAILAMSSIYGIDILQDNVTECRQRLLQSFSEQYTALFKDACKPECSRSAEKILELNILWGDALSLTVPGDNGRPIVFCEWSPVGGTFLKRRDFTMKNLLENQPLEGLNLFSDLGEQAFLPVAIAEYPPAHFLEIGK